MTWPPDLGDPVEGGEWFEALPQHAPELSRLTSNRDRKPIVKGPEVVTGFRLWVVLVANVARSIPPRVSGASFTPEDLEGTGSFSGLVVKRAIETVAALSDEDRSALVSTLLLCPGRIEAIGALSRVVFPRGTPYPKALAFVFEGEP